MTAGAGRSVTYTAFNMADVITAGTTSANLDYDEAHQRIRQTLTQGSTVTTTTYLNDPASGAMSEAAITGTTTTWHDYLLADGHFVAERFCTGAAPCSSGGSWNYFVDDHLGSIAVVMSSAGVVVERDYYDAWGKRRNADGSDNTACSLTSLTTRGFTGQEEIDAVCLINANARIYDPTLGRFMTPDPTVESPYDLQDLNRYSYVGNNPLSFTDPSGMCFLACFWKQSWFGALLDVALFAVGLPELEGFDVFASGFSLSQLEVPLLVTNGALAGGISAGVGGGKYASGGGHLAVRVGG